MKSQASTPTTFSLLVAGVILVSAFAMNGSAQTPSANEWTQWRGSDRAGIWNEADAKAKFDTESLDPIWKVEIGSGYSGPTVANNRVYLMDRITDPQQMERVLCFDASNGEQIWKKEYACKYVGVGYPAGPRASVTIDGDQAFALGTMGNLHCLNAETGEQIWAMDLNKTYNIQVLKDRQKNRMPIWGMTCSPLVYKNLVILQIGAIDAGVIALDKSTGKEVWRSTSDRGQYSSPVLTQQNGKDVVVCWTGDNVCGIAPESGKVYWEHEMKARLPIGCASPVIDGDRIFVTSFYDGSLLLRMKQDEMAVEKVWRKVGASETNTEALHSMISTPIFVDDHIYGVDSYGELRCLDAKTGERIWEDLSAVPKARWSNIHFVKGTQNTWLFNERGELIIADLNPTGFKEIDRTKIIEPTTDQLPQRGGVCWSHPAFAMKSIFARNDKELIRVDLGK